MLMAGCSQQEAPKAAPAPAAKRELSLETVAAQGKGFTVGAMMSSNPVYVFFDAQCPHCGHLWEASLPLQKKLKFVWIPVGWINASSTAQGAALLTATNPGALMSEHEASLLAKKGGISAPRRDRAGHQEQHAVAQQLRRGGGALHRGAQREDRPDGEP